MLSFRIWQLTLFLCFLHFSNMIIFSVLLHFFIFCMHLSHCLISSLVISDKPNLWCDLIVKVFTGVSSSRAFVTFFEKISTISSTLSHVSVSDQSFAARHAFHFSLVKNFWLLFEVRVLIIRLNQEHWWFHWNWKLDSCTYLK